MNEAEIRAIGGGQASVFSARSPAKSAGNEDAAALLPFGGAACVLVVADGMGGERAGHEAAARAVRSMQAAIAMAEREGWLLRTAILDGMERANQAVLDLGVGAGTTLAVVEVQNGSVRPYHVGDSTILLVGQRGKLKLQTIAHSPVGFAVEAGMLDESEAMHHEDRHIVSNMLGAPDMRIEVGSARRLAPRDTLLLASDGLSDNLRTDEIVQRIRTGSLEEGARRLVRAARRRMDAPIEGEPSKPDDLTFVSYRRGH
ncbi:MAG: protein phosphatase 2C domain-containing protein [Myxococcales bacterium]|nr:protein phosphatase 2C domain-containing protein [Myxococcales bacterium]MDH5566616.1 protein phosphatase 2C domain-containing protein [Myxococcales bacterium]